MVTCTDSGTSAIMFMTRIMAALAVASTCGAATQPSAGPDRALDQDDVAVIRAVVDSTILPEIRSAIGCRPNFATRISGRIVDSTILPEIRVAKFGRQPIALLIDETVKLCNAEERRVQPWRCLGDPRGLPRERKTETSFRVPDLKRPSVRLVTLDVVQRAFEGRRDEP